MSTARRGLLNQDARGLTNSAWRNVSSLCKSAGAHKVFQLLHDIAFTDKYQPKVADRLEAGRQLLHYAYGKPVERSLTIQAEIGAQDAAGLLPELDASAFIALGRTLHAQGLLAPNLTPGADIIDAEQAEMTQETEERDGNNKLDAPVPEPIEPPQPPETTGARARPAPKGKRAQPVETTSRGSNDPDDS